MSDLWRQDDFEDVVARALIACFETRLKKDRHAPNAERMSPARVQLFRSEGPYIPGRARLITVLPGEKPLFDLTTDRLPVRGCYAFIPRGNNAACCPDAYLCVYYVRRADKLPPTWHRHSGGALYEQFMIRARPEFLDGERRFFTVDAQGISHTCTQRLTGYTVGHPDGWNGAVEFAGGSTLQWLADRRFCWQITAQEKTAKVHLGCEREEVKSLLYARSLPLSATGRKRPVLHLVEAHKRRLAQGTDIDIAPFLRGLQMVEIAGTTFIVRPPPVIRPEVSKTSQKRYFDSEEAPRSQESAHA